MIEMETGMIKTIVTKDGVKIRIVYGDDPFLTESDKEMDRRASEAIKAAINKAIVCKKPIAKYDKERKKAYLEFPGGIKQYTK